MDIRLIIFTMDRSNYYNLLKEFNFSPSSFSEIAKDLMVLGVKEMYHALVNEVDIGQVISIPNIKVIWCCRCHLVADDGSTDHEHWHALIQFKKGHTLVAYKKRLQRAKLRLRSRKTVFKRVLCPDQAIGILRYITCKDGQRYTRRGADGLMGAPHTHYDRSVFEEKLLHARGHLCGKTRDEIFDGVTEHLSPDWMLKNGSSLVNKELHNYDTCRCARGKARKAEKQAANEKRRNYYKTEEGLATKKRYQDRVALKRKVVDEISSLDLGQKGDLVIHMINALI